MLSNILSTKVTWNDIKDDESMMFECPITGGHIWIIDFKDIYAPFLETLNGFDPDGLAD